MRAIRHWSAASAILILSVGALAIADPPTTAPSTEPAIAINWDQAKDHVGHNAAVTGPVMGTHDFGDSAVLNIGKDFPDHDRFTFYIPADKRTGVPDDLYQGKIITATGKIELYNGVPEIKGGKDDVAVIGIATTEPATQP